MKKHAGLVLIFLAAVASFAAYDGAKPADDEYAADVPAVVRENLRALKEDAIVNAGTLGGNASSAFAKLGTAGSFSARIDFSAAEATNFTATPTINGVDVFGDISTALDEIIGAP